MLMKTYLRVLVILIVQLLVAFYSWSQTDLTTSSTGGLAKADTASASIPINAIKAANIKLIEADANKQIVALQLLTIKDQRAVITELESINKDLQNRIIQANNNNERLSKDIDKYRKRSKIATWAAGISGSGFIVLLLILL